MYRGYLIEITRETEDPEPHGGVHKFGQVYLVGDPVRGTICGFHRHEEFYDCFFISHGSVKCVLKEDREDSVTYGGLISIVINSKHPRLNGVPPGVFHGWMSL